MEHVFKTLVLCSIFAFSLAFPNPEERDEEVRSTGTISSALINETTTANTSNTEVPASTTDSTSTSPTLQLVPNSETPNNLTTAELNLLPKYNSSQSYNEDELTINLNETNDLPVFEETDENGVTENGIGMNDGGGYFLTSATTSSSIFVPAPIRIDPSIQLLPPPLRGSEFSPPSTTVSPRNLREIPISLVSLSGNSGGSEESNQPNHSSPNNSVDFTKFRYHVETGKLHKIGSTGPGICPPNMRFFAVPGHNKNGACDCDYYQCSRPLIYSLERHECFWAWSQGPCEKGEWFVFNSNPRQKGQCVRNPCPDDSSNSTATEYNPLAYLPTPTPSYSSEEYFFQSPEDGQCYRAGTQGYCADKDERLLIYPGEPVPKCRTFTVCYPLTVPQELQCILGNKYYHESGQC